MNIINIEHISKIFGDKVIFQDASCGIQERLELSELTGPEKPHF